MFPEQFADRWMKRPQTMDDEGLLPSHREGRQEAWEETLAQIQTPGHTPYIVRHPSGLIGQHMGTHLSVYAPRKPGQVADNLVGRVMFPNTPKRTSRTGWPDTMDAIDALDEAVKRMPGLLPQ